VNTQSRSLFVCDVSKTQIKCAVDMRVTETSAVAHRTVHASRALRWYSMLSVPLLQTLLSQATLSAQAHLFPVLVFHEPIRRTSYLLTVPDDH
jgi:hypothetical protein